MFVRKQWVKILGQKQQLLVRGHSQSMLTRRGRQVVLEMSRICRFLPITVKEFRHKCQHYRQAGNNEQNLFNIVFVCLCKYVCSVAVESLKSNYPHQSGQFRNFGVWKATKFWKSRSKLNLPKSIVCTFPKLYNLVYQESCFETKETVERSHSMY